MGDEPASTFGQGKHRYTSHPIGAWVMLWQRGHARAVFHFNMVVHAFKSRAA